MAEKKIAPYGSWKSPITTRLVVTKGGTKFKFGGTVVDGEDVYWREIRPVEKGRYVIVRRTPDGKTTDVNPAPYNVRTRVHEYGGTSFTVSEGVMYFVNFPDQRIFRLEPGGEPVPLTPEINVRYADLVVDRKRLRLHCVMEDHRAGDREAQNLLASIDLVTGEVVQVLAAGNDFYANPRLSPDGSKLSWITWNHPNMPWDGTEVYVAEFQPDGSLGEPQFVAGGKTEAIFQPEWSPDGRLYFVSDRSNWWNFYRWDGAQVEPVLLMEAEFAVPQWVFGYKTYNFVSAETIACMYTQDGIWQIATLDVESGALHTIETPYTFFEYPDVVGDKMVVVAGSSQRSTTVILVDLGSDEYEVLREEDGEQVDAGYLSVPESIEFPTTGGKTAYGLYYPPQNADYEAPAGEKPPLLIMIHGGPTAATSTQLLFDLQYFPSRGIAVLDLNYGGSTGYGREFRERLYGQWGVVDLDDSVNGAKYLVERGDVDGDRLAITGGSAGGYTTLCALTFSDVFSAGASHYGVSDITALALETHKFEAHYMDSLVGPYPEAKELYDARSPLQNTDKLNTPVIFFQGLDDKVVPPNQAEMMVAALRQKGVPVAYVPFEGEQHGFRIAENVERALEGELYFYGRIFGFEPADEIEPIEIENYK
ncbi:MAG: S9 family peptidase [Anaerolineales bacterium]|nr:S9 family peptidase [Anaerolineales bacterium]